MIDDDRMMTVVRAAVDTLSFDDVDDELARFKRGTARRTQTRRLLGGGAALLLLVAVLGISLTGGADPGVSVAATPGRVWDPPAPEGAQPPEPLPVARSGEQMCSLLDPARLEELLGTAVTLNPDSSTRPGAVEPTGFGCGVTRDADRNFRLGVVRFHVEQSGDRASWPNSCGGGPVTIELVTLRGHDALFCKSDAMFFIRIRSGEAIYGIYVSRKWPGMEVVEERDLRDLAEALVGNAAKIR